MAAPKKVKTENIISESSQELKGIVTVIATGKSPFMKKDKEYKVSAEHAQTLIKNGSAILK